MQRRYVLLLTKKEKERRVFIACVEQLLESSYINTHIGEYL
jgi:hypothetical protein